jgi:hypothetical protein
MECITISSLDTRKTYRFQHRPRWQETESCSSQVIDSRVEDALFDTKGQYSKATESEVVSLTLGTLFHLNELHLQCAAPFFQGGLNSSSAGSVFSLHFFMPAQYIRNIRCAKLPH